jgi:hypothetical protein
MTETVGERAKTALGNKSDCRARYDRNVPAREQERDSNRDIAERAAGLQKEHTRQDQKPLKMTLSVTHGQ